MFTARAANSCFHDLFICPGETNSTSATPHGPSDPPQLIQRDPTQVTFDFTTRKWRLTLSALPGQTVLQISSRQLFTSIILTAASSSSCSSGKLNSRVLSYQSLLFKTPGLLPMVGKGVLGFVEPLSILGQFQNIARCKHPSLTSTPFASGH